ncbi:MAG TPA: ABC transporter ATP-binding protein [Desulfovibrio sp.]|jgi:lipoprotein-releasing system ATP-binding protein|uniref:ABC transporter ATP-binding protein n=1 Tax=Desulfovibrio TaxID=872 RepID=UPI0004242470|nr:MULTISPECIES: ABC transporter ATP-binding protein [Desulfovibrio]MDY0306514.1 ABC transporter ATP-binding protein [Desulfovibrionaceae bacterium]HMM37404.1 ABC transporter ATP-binding protein [Desulfovibrio sp.]
MNSEPLYLLTGVGKEYDGPTERLRVLGKIDLRIEAGESVAIIGASGSGKTTLLHIMGTLDTPTHGDVRFAGQSLKGLSVQKRSVLRNRDIGFVFQFHHLLAEFSTLENVAMPGIIGGLGREASLRLAREALGQVGMEHRMEHRVTTLSGGERQRAAIARAILLKPKVVLADEPTGNLDEKTGQAVGDLLVSLNRDLGMTFVVVTHNVDLASVMGRRLELRSGELYAH